MLRILATNKQQKRRDTRKLWEVLDLSVPLIVVMVGQMLAHVHIHQTVHITHVQFPAYQLHLHKAVKYTQNNMRPSTWGSGDQNEAKDDDK